MKTINRYVSGSAAVLLAISLAACSRTNNRTARNENTNTPAETTANAPKRAMVRFVNAEPGGGPMDLWFGDQKVFSSIGFKGATEYRELPAERHEFKLRYSGKDVGDPLATNSEGLSDGKHYTVVAMPKKSNNKNEVTLNAMNDDTDNPPAGKARVRVVNADKSLGEIDLVQPGQKDAMIGGINVDSTTRYKDVDPADTLAVRDSRNKQIAAKIPEGIASGKNYTFIVMGMQGAKTPDVLRLEDGPMTTASNR